MHQQSIDALSIIKNLIDKATKKGVFKTAQKAMEAINAYNVIAGSISDPQNKSTDQNIEENK